MQLHAHSFRLELTPLSQVDDEDWCTVRAKVDTGHFKGAFDGWLQGEDLKRFCQELKLLDGNPGRPGTATLVSAEPNIEIILSMQTLGELRGSYTFQPEPPGATVLSGNFEADQSFLPALIQSVNDLLVALRVENAA